MRNPVLDLLNAIDHLDEQLSDSVQGGDDIFEDLMEAQRTIWDAYRKLVDDHRNDPDRFYPEVITF